MSEQVVIAVRGGAGSKSRCAPVLDGAAREALTAAMLDDMLAAVTTGRSASQVWVVTPTAALARRAQRHDVRVLIQDGRNDLNAAFRQALREISDAAPYEAVALLPGDLPRLQPSELTAAFILARTHAVVLAPSTDGGTGALVLRAGAGLPPAFGPGSAMAHRQAAARLGLPLAQVTADSLRRDIDGPEDLRDLMRSGSQGLAAAFLRQHLQQSLDQ